MVNHNRQTLVCEGRRARHAAYTSSFFFLAAAVDIRVNNPTVNVGIHWQQLNNNAVVWLHLRMPLAQGQDPKCNIPGVTAYGTVTDPAISPFHIRTSSINRTRKIHKLSFPAICLSVVNGTDSIKFLAFHWRFLLTWRILDLDVPLSILFSFIFKLSSE